MPTVSVIIPTYNRADALQCTLESVLNQTYEDIEMIVVDDASTDETATVMSRYDDPRVTFLEHEANRGGSAARNTGIERATGEYIALLDSDDEWLPRKIERQIEVLEHRSDEWVATYCGVEMVTTSDNGPFYGTVADLFSRRNETEGMEGGEELVRSMLSDDLHTSAGSTLVVQSDVVEKMGGFDESFDRFQDSEFLIRVLRRGKLAYVDAPLVRRHESGNPSAADLEVADEHYLQSFGDTVSRLEADGYDILGAHRYMLAKAHLAEGNLLRGSRYLARARRPTPRQYPGLAYSLYTGIRRKLDGVGSSA